jgi:hypothetical protein
LQVLFLDRLYPQPVQIPLLQRLHNSGLAGGERLRLDGDARKMTWSTAGDSGCSSGTFSTLGTLLLLGAFGRAGSIHMSVVLPHTHD